MRAIDGGVEVDLWVVPGASRSALAGLHGEAIRIRVAAPPEGGKANRAVARLLEGLTGGSVELVRGARSRHKTVRITGVDVATVRRALDPPPP